MDNGNKKRRAVIISGPWAQGSATIERIAFGWRGARVAIEHFLLNLAAGENDQKCVRENRGNNDGGLTELLLLIAFQK
jgi:hypothetical protein